MAIAIINETSCHFTKEEINNLVYRVSQSKVKVDYLEVKQDGLLANNQSKEIRCGDNGIFKGVPITMEQEKLATISKKNLRLAFLFLFFFCDWDGAIAMSQLKLFKLLPWIACFLYAVEHSTSDSDRLSCRGAWDLLFQT